MVSAARSPHPELLMSFSRLHIGLTANEYERSLPLEQRCDFPSRHEIYTAVLNALLSAQMSLWVVYNRFSLEVSQSKYFDLLKH
jgi:hypothetical protein